MLHLPSRPRSSAAWAGPILLAIIAAGVITGITMQSPAVFFTILFGALVLALLINAPALRRERWATVRVPSTVASFEPEPLVQRAIATPSGEVRQAIVVPVTQAEGYQLVLTVDGYMLLNERGDVVKLPERAVER